MEQKLYKESKKVLDKMKDRRTNMQQGRLAHENGQSEKQKGGLKMEPKRDPSPREASEEVKEGSHLDHPRVKAIKQKKLVNDTAYFLHHPQIKPHGPNLPPKKPRS